MKRELCLYICFVRALFFPGTTFPRVPGNPIEPGDISDWAPEELNLLIIEGRRQLDRERAEYDRIQSRAQHLFTVAAALLVALAAGLAATSKVAKALIAIAAVIDVTGLLGAAALLTNRAEFGGVDAALFAQERDEVQLDLARAYAASVDTGEREIATRVTIYRDAVLLVLLAAVAGLFGWVSNQIVA